ncbi:MAG: DUF2752 domain-containing protein [Dysgonamonadaceae bacterium]|jgi:hypothetical protein|nr:DUF2752 domain-containing protein [Dysgonamonadaceae bacterium]
MQKKVWIGALGILFVAPIVLYFFFDPKQNEIFPRCLFLSLTGYECPGCGSQRAIHDLLHLRILSAFHENALFVILIPYIALGIYLEFFGGKKRFPKLLPLFFGKWAAVLILLLILLFWVGRNVVF